MAVSSKHGASLSPEQSSFQSIPASSSRMRSSTKGLQRPTLHAALHRFIKAQLEGCMGFGQTGTSLLAALLAVDEPTQFELVQSKDKAAILPPGHPPSSSHTRVNSKSVQTLERQPAPCPAGHETVASGFLQLF